MIKRFMLIAFTLLLSLNSITVYADETTESDSDSSKESITAPNAHITGKDVIDNKNAKELWDYCIKNGESEWWAATVIGNAIAEQGLKTDMSPNSSGYWGAFQFSSGSAGISKFKSWCSGKGMKPESISAQYEYLSVYRGSCIKALTGVDYNVLRKDTSVVKDAKTAAAYFALGMEGCTCWSGIKSGSGHIWHSGHGKNCGEYDFSSTSKYGKVSLQGLPSRTGNTEVVYKVFKGSIPTSNSQNQNGETLEGVVSEKDITGMPKDSTLLDNQDTVGLGTRDDLSIKQQYIMSVVGNNIDITKESDALDLSRKIVTFVGLLIVNYAIVLFICMIGDKMNNWVELNFVNLATFGKVNYYPNEQDISSSNKYSSTKKLTIALIIMFIIGMGIISGGIFKGLSQFVYWFSQKFI